MKNKVLITSECGFFGHHLVEHILKKTDWNNELVDFHSSRPGHDLRYALDGAKMEKIGWSLPLSFEQSLEKSVRWLIENPK